MADEKKKIAKKKNITYLYKGMNSARKEVKGEIQAISIAEAKKKLRTKNVRVLSLKKKPKPLFSQGKPVESGDITFASRQMATMIGAGMPVAQTLQAIGVGHEKKSMEDLLGKIHSEVETGTSLSNALAQHPVHFNKLYTSLVAAGEESGKLDTLLDRVATYQEKMEYIRKKIKSALTYPISILVIATGVTIILLIFVIPQFEALFQDFGADLPALTRKVVDMSRWMQDNWWKFIGVIVIAVIGFLQALKRSEKFKFAVDRLSLKLPVFGVVLKKSCLARFSRTLGIIFGAGVPLVEGMNTVAASSGNRVYENGILEIKNQISTGQPLALSMQETKLFPNMMVQMVSSGEESGELEVMLGKVADFYESEVDEAVENLASLIEPIMIVILGGIIGTMILAMYMPIFKLGSVI
jgi:type IV pilus assembly protein PilC